MELKKFKLKDLVNFQGDIKKITDEMNAGMYKGEKVTMKERT